MTAAELESLIYSCTGEETEIEYILNNPLLLDKTFVLCQSKKINYMNDFDSFVFNNFKAFLLKLVVKAKTEEQVQLLEHFCLNCLYKENNEKSVDRVLSLLTEIEDFIDVCDDAPLITTNSITFESVLRVLSYSSELLE